MSTKQEKVWSNEFGKEYTDRNIFSPKQLDDVYKKAFNVTRTAMNNEFLSNLNNEIKILEVGSNVGNQLRLLQQMGYKNLYGIELQTYAVEKSKELTKNINIIQGSGFDIPFKDNFFDLVFTSGVLIHIHPNNLLKIMSEIYRTTKKYIWGFEYYSENCKEINYRNNSELLWKNNFKQIYINNFDNLLLLKNKKYKYTDSDNVDEMFLLEKQVKK